MGLDMYLTKVKREQVAYWRKANAIHAWFERRFEENYHEELENCQEYYVSKEDLLALKQDCENVLKSSRLVSSQIVVGSRWNEEKNDYDKIYRQGKVLEDSSVAEELLPTQSGFFYGSTQYDEYYIEDLKSTVEQINKILAETDFKEYDIMYHAWW